MRFPAVFVGLALCASLMGCTVVGTGYRTVIRAGCGDVKTEQDDGKGEDRQRLCDDFSRRFPHLIAASDLSGERKTLRIDPEGRPIDPARMRQPSARQPSYQDFLDFMRLKYGGETFRAVDLSFTAHERTSVPPYLAVDPRPSFAATLTALFTSNMELSTEKKIEIQNLLEARLRNIPDLGLATAPHHSDLCGKDCRTDFDDCVEKCFNDLVCNEPEAAESATERREGCEAKCSVPGTVYFYYPRLSIDFSSNFLSTSVADRLSYLALVIRLHEEASAKSVRFLDFRPKDADIVEFSRGDLTQTLQVQASANVGATGSESVKVTQSPTEKTSATGDSAGASTGVTFTEAFATKLLDAIEKRSTGILDDGRTFFADFRALRQIRVAGTYNFDLMLEVPATLKREGASLILESEPVQPEIKADVLLLGVVRHVHDRGRVGVLQRVPESENDHVYEQVVMRTLPGEILWRAPREPWIDTVVPEGPANCGLRVVTNRDDAGFVIQDASGKVIANGAGRKAEFSFPRAKDACGEALVCESLKVMFLPVVLPGAPPTVLRAAEAVVDFGDSTERIVEGAYVPKKP